MPIGWWTKLQGHDLQEERRRDEEFKKEKFDGRWKFLGKRRKNGDRRGAEENNYNKDNWIRGKKGEEKKIFG